MCEEGGGYELLVVVVLVVVVVCHGWGSQRLDSFCTFKLT